MGGEVDFDEIELDYKSEGSAMSKIHIDAIHRFKNYLASG